MTVETTDIPKRKPGRPRGSKYSKPLAVRVTPEAEKAMRMGSKIVGMSLSKFLRLGVYNRLALLAVVVEQQLHEERDMPEYRRERLENFLMAARKAVLSLYGPRHRLQFWERLEHEARKIFWGYGRTRTTTRPDRKVVQRFEHLESQLIGSEGDEKPESAMLN